MHPLFIEMTQVWDGTHDISSCVSAECLRSLSILFYRFASKLRVAGRLLELVVIPGAKHGSGSQPHFSVWRLEREAWRFAIQEYLVKE